MQKFAVIGEKGNCKFCPEQKSCVLGNLTQHARQLACGNYLGMSGFSLTTIDAGPNITTSTKWKIIRPALTYFVNN